MLPATPLVSWLSVFTAARAAGRNVLRGRFESLTPPLPTQQKLFHYAAICNYGTFLLNGTFANQLMVVKGASLPLQRTQTQL